MYYHFLAQTQLARLTRVQYRAARLCSGALPFTSQVKLELDMCWESLADRADFLSLTVFHKFVLGLTRPLIKKCMPLPKEKKKIGHLSPFTLSPLNMTFQSRILW